MISSAKVNYYYKLASFLSLFMVALYFIWGCGRYRSITPKDALSPVSGSIIENLDDDLSNESLLTALKASIDYLGIKNNHPIRFGNRYYSAKTVMDSLIAFQRFLEDRGGDKKALKKYLLLNFDVYKARGNDGHGKLLLTGYYEPVLRGSLEKMGPFKYPIYGIPDELVYVDLFKFGGKYDKKRLVGRLEGRHVLPFYSRDEIEKGALTGKGYEICFVDDPLDLFFLHIQGSGQIILTDGTSFQVSYRASNGYPYRSIGRLLIEQKKISREDMSLSAIKKYFKQHPEEQEAILSYNQSYVFFRKVEKGPVGALGKVLTAGRSIATDHNFFPPGAMAILKSRVPIVDISGKIIGWRPFTRLVFNQDRGGAIKGPGRIDLFFGAGDLAGIAAGYMKEKAMLFFLAPKAGKSLPENTNTNSYGR